MANSIKFMNEGFDAKYGSIKPDLCEEIYTVLKRLTEAKMSPEDEKDTKLLYSIYDKIKERSNAKLTPEEQSVLKKYNIQSLARGLGDAYANIPYIDENGDDNELDLYYPIKNHGSEKYNRNINLADRARKMVPRESNKYVTTKDDQYRKNYKDMKYYLADKKSHNKSIQDIKGRYVDKESELKRQLDDLYARRDSEVGSHARSIDYLDSKINKMLKRESVAGNNMKFKLVENRLNEKTIPDYNPRKTGTAYKVFKVRNGKLYPPMVANRNNEDTPVGVWLEAEEGEFAGLSKTGRKQVKSTGSGKLSYRPGWHLGEVPRAPQFDRTNKETGEKEFPKDFVWALCSYVMDIDYQPESDEQGYMRTRVNKDGDIEEYRSNKYQHSLAGLHKLPKDGYYKYRTNPRPDTVPWIITGNIRVDKLLDDYQVNSILEREGIKPIHRQGGDKTLKELGLK